MKKLMKCLFLIILSGCGTDDPIVEIPELNEIRITSSVGDLIDLGSEVSLTVSGFDQFEKSIAITETVVWSVNNNNVSVDQNGKVTALAVGESIITATVDEFTDTYEIEVWDSTAPRTEIYVSDAGNFNSPPWQILKYKEDGSDPQVFITEQLGWPQDILFMENEGTVLVSNLNTGNLAKYNAETGVFISNFAIGIGQPTRMKIGPDDLLYVLQWAGNGKVLRYQLDGTPVDEFTDVGVVQSIGLDWDVDGNLYVSSFNDKTVRKFDTSGNDLGLFVNSDLQGPTNIWFDESGVLWVNDWQGNSVKRFDADGNFLGTQISGIGNPEGIDFMDNGNLLIGSSSGGNGLVKMYNSSGSFISDLVPSGSGNLIAANAVVIRRINQ
ncbi:MAG: Ig-like domain-containing protein [Cyclobacteriaceae bacterium]